MLNIIRQDNGLFKKIIIFITVIAVVVWAFIGLDIEFRGGVQGFVDFVTLMFPPDFSILPELVTPFFQTFQIAIVAIFFSPIIALVIAPFAASNLTKNKTICYTMKTILGILRGIPPLLYALVFVSTVGLGPFAGALALIFHVVGALGRFFSDSMESVNMSAIEAMRIDGANKLQIYIYGVIPGVGEYILGYILYFFEYCVRTSAILGLVGAGGLGYKLIADMKLFQYDRSIVTFMVILVIIIVMDKVNLY